MEGACEPDDLQAAVGVRLDSAAYYRRAHLVAIFRAEGMSWNALQKRVPVKGITRTVWIGWQIIEGHAAAVRSHASLDQRESIGNRAAPALNVAIKANVGARGAAQPERRHGYSAWRRRKREFENGGSEGGETTR